MLRKLGRDVALYGGADLLFRIAQFLVIPVYAHLLSVAEFGVLALLTVTSALIGMLLNLGVNNSVQRFYFEPGPHSAERQLLVSTGLVQLVLSGVIVTLVALLVAKLLRTELETSYGIAWPMLLITLFTVVPEQIAQYCLDAVRLQFAPAKFFIIHVVKSLFGILVGFWLLLEWNMGVTGLILGTLVGAVAAVPVGLLMIRSDLVLRFDLTAAGKIFRYGYPFVLAGTAYWVFGSMDRWMLMALSDATEVGLFSIGTKFAAVLTFVIAAFAQAWSPFAMRLRGEDADYRRHYATIFSGWFFLLALAGLALAMFAPEMLRLLTPQAYWPAAPVLAIAAAGLVLYGTVQISVLGISLERRTMLLSFGAWLAAGANVLLNLLLIPRYGAIGAAVSTVAAYGLLTGSFLWWSQRLHPIPLERAKLLYSLAMVGCSLAAPVLLAPLGMGAVGVAAKLALLLAAVVGSILVGLLDHKLYRRMRALVG